MRISFSGVTNPFGFILLLAWVAGAVLAKGTWSTLFCVFPFWAWYLVIEKVMMHFSII